MKKRFLALFLCCVMVFTLLPAALTTAFATGEADGEQDEQDEPPVVCTCDAAEGAAHAEDCPLYVNPEQPTGEQDEQDEPPVACTCDAAEGAAHAEDCPLYVAPEQPDGEQDKQDEQPVVCTCNAAEGAAHAEDCPLYVAPEQPADEQDKQDEQPVACTCGAAEGAAHAEDCPLYVNPEQPDDEQQPEEEQTDYTEVYEQLMAAETAEELDALLDSFADEAAMDEFLAWLDANDKRTALEEHIAALNEQETLEQEEDTAILPMVVPFTNVGPLLPAAVLRRANAPMAVAALDGNNGNGSSNNNNGLVLSKKAEPVADGYKITMEAYATGASSTTVSTKPADIVLVLDMSGSMEYCMVCGKKQDSGTHATDSYTYKPTYSVTTNWNAPDYYIKDGDGYVHVKYCRGDVWAHSSSGNRHEESWVPTSLNDSGHEHYDYISKNGVMLPKTNANDTAANRVQFYTYTNREPCTPRINALKSAVNGFIDNVGKLSPDSQIALVKFAGKLTNTVGNNTYIDGSFTYNYSQIVKNLTTVQGNEQTLKNAVSALSPAGATRADYGMQHAQSIITNDKTDHNKVVVMFTDGEPTSSNSFEDKVANAAIAHSKSIKDANATVYTIGVFAGADGTPVTSLDDVSKTNKYMHLVSSNYKNATDMDTPGDATYPEGGKSYYLSAADQGQLENIFQQISQETGGSSVQYGTETIIKDIVTPYFTMPANATDIQLFTAESNGSANSWRARESFNGSVAIQGNTVSVSGFSFKDNWCGTHTASGGTTFHDGKKLIIEFTVSPKAGFLGGNGVPTNTSAGIYENATAQEPVKTFPIPTVNVPIQDVTVTAVDKNVYLLGTVTENDCKNGATAKCNGVDLLKESEYTGENAWKADYVKITTTVTKPDAALTDDGTYTISVKVAPKPQESGIVPPVGTQATAKTGTITKNINVFTPELTFKDTEAYYGADVPTNLNSNWTKTEWKHGTTVADPATMLGTAPELTVTCTPDASKIADGKINTTDDIGVAVTVKIGSTDVTGKTTFQHTNCANKTCTVPNDYQFLIHVKTCTLTVKKELAAGTTADDGQSFIFTITGPGIAKRVVIQGDGSVTLKGLKVGEYTVKEDTNWSWRYKTTDGTQTATLSAANPEGSVTVTNTLENHQWVSTDVYCKNEFKNGGIKTIINGSGKTVNGNPVNN